MVKRTEKEILQSLNKTNWDFEDYSSSRYPLDLNSIPWYPASFPAPIPKYLVGLLSETGDIVFDPFGGKGTTAVEALKQRRKFIYNDLNPHAVLIMRCLLDAISQDGGEESILRVVSKDRSAMARIASVGARQNYKGKDEKLILEKLPESIDNELSKRRIKRDVIYWFHAETLMELILLFDYINSFDGTAQGIRKLAFLSILKEVSSQRGHFSYVTDNCKPTEMKYYSATDAYIDMIDRVQRACINFIKQYEVINKTHDLQEYRKLCVIHEGDAKNCSYIPDASVDLIITSPPYLCAQDYILTMRLNDFFFPDEGFVNMPFREIGPRRLRTRPGIVTAYFDDMNLALKEMYRVLKDDAFFCLIIGQGKGKVSDGIDVIKKIKQYAEKNGFTELFEATRNINYRTNRIGGVDKEDLILYRKNNSPQIKAEG